VKIILHIIFASFEKVNVYFISLVFKSGVLFVSTGRVIRDWGSSPPPSMGGLTRSLNKLSSSPEGSLYYVCSPF